MNKKVIIRILIGLMLIVAIGSGIAYLMLREEQPWKAFLIAGCGGVIIFNFLISLFLINKNFKK